MKLSARILNCLSIFAIGNVFAQPCQLSASFGYSVAYGGIATFSSNSTGTIAGSTYVWDFGDSSPAVSGISPSHPYTTGNYTVALTVTNYSGCTSTYTHEVFACALTSTLTQTVMPGGVVLFQVQASNTLSTLGGCAWNFGANGGVQPGSPSQSHTYTAPGTYTVFFIAFDNGYTACTTTQTTIVVITSASLSTRISQEGPGDKWQITTIPMEGSLSVKMPKGAGPAHLVLYNIIDGIVLTEVVRDNNTVLRIPSGASGVYFYSIIEDSGGINMGKLLLSKP
jgi:PKD repeat protein